MELYSRILGEGEPLIIMHGVFGMGDNWQTLGRGWSEKFEVHLMDMRNHGRSPHTDEFSYEAMADDIAQYMDNKGIAKANILGHSMGGKVGMLFSVYHPEKVIKLIVADIAPKAYEPHHQEIIAGLKSLNLKEIKSRGEAEKQLAEKIDEIGTRQFLLKSLYWKEKGLLDWRFNLRVIGNEINRVGESLADNAVFFGPCLFVRGGASWYIEDEDEELILEHFPEAGIETIDGAGHWLHAEKPKEFYSVVTEFLGA